MLKVEIVVDSEDDEEIRNELRIYHNNVLIRRNKY